MVWHETFQPAAFIPWKALERAVTFNNVVHHMSTPCFGLVVRDVAEVEMADRRRESLHLQFAQTGCHFVYVSENLLYPSKDLAAIVNYYIEQPVRRAELSTGVTLSRVEEIVEGQSFKAQSVGAVQYVRDPLICTGKISPHYAATAET